MPAEQINPPTNPTAAPQQTGLPQPWARPLAIASAVLFVISSGFPAVAGLSKNTAAFPKWWGRLDVGLAFVLAVLALSIMALAEGKVNQQAVDATYRAYRILTHGIFVMLVMFFLAGDRIIWSNCLTGFAWRAWLLAYCLPAWFTAFAGGRSFSSDLSPAQ
jgi:hypothetical protein